MTNTVTNILSHDEELALRKPIEDYVGKIQAEIDELREEGTNKVLEYSEEIEVLKRDKIYTKSEKEARISELNGKLQKAKEIEAKNKQPINDKIAVAEKYLKDHYQTDYYNKVVESNKYEVQKAKADYDKKLKELCLQIWENPNYKKALDILNNHKPDIFNQISEYLQKILKEQYLQVVELDDSSKSYVRFSDNSWLNIEQKKGDGWTTSKNVLLYEFQNSIYGGLNLKLIIGPSTNENIRVKLFEIATKNDKFKPGKSLSKKWNQIYSISMISKEEITEK